MGFDMIPHQFTFLFQSQAFLLTLFSRDPNILRPFHGLSAKQRNPIRGRPKQGCITCTWQLLFIANLPNSCFSCWFISLSSETCLTNSISFFLLNWQCELGRVRILHSRPQHLIAKHFDFHLRKWLPSCDFAICKAKAHAFLSAASERDCVRELQCLAPDGSPALSLVVSEEYFNSKFNERRRTNESKFMAHVYKSKHASEWSPSWCTCIVTQIPVQHTGMTLWRWASEHMTGGRRGGGRTARRLASFPSPTSASRWRAGRNPIQYVYTI